MVYDSMNEKRELHGSDPPFDINKECRLLMAKTGSDMIAIISLNNGNVGVGSDWNINVDADTNKYAEFIALMQLIIASVNNEQGLHLTKLIVKDPVLADIAIKCLSMRVNAMINEIKGVK